MFPAFQQQVFVRFLQQMFSELFFRKCFPDLCYKCILHLCPRSVSETSATSISWTYLQQVFHRRLQHVPPRLLQYVFRPLTLSELTFAFFSHMFPELQRHSQGREPSSHHQTRKPSRSDTTADPNKSMSIERCLATEPDAFVRRIRQHAVLGQYRGSVGRGGGGVGWVNLMPLIC